MEDSDRELWKETNELLMRLVIVSEASGIFLESISQSLAIIAQCCPCAPVPSDLEILVKGRTTMAKKVKLTMKSGKGQVMPSINLSDLVAAGNGLQLQLVDASGAPFNITDPTLVTTTLTTDNASVVPAAGVDSLHYLLSVPSPLSSSSTTLNVSATLAYVAGTPGPFTASLPILLNLPVPTPTPTDLQILIG